MWFILLHIPNNWSVVNNESGAKTGLSGITMGIIIGCALLFLAPLFREIPQSTSLVFRNLDDDSNVSLHEVRGCLDFVFCVQLCWIGLLGMRHAQKRKQIPTIMLVQAILLVLILTMVLDIFVIAKMDFTEILISHMGAKVRTVEEQVRAAAEHKLGVANQSITAGFFDNNTSAEDRREYLESVLRECKKEEAALVVDDDALNDLLARREVENNHINRCLLSLQSCSRDSTFWIGI